MASYVEWVRGRWLWAAMIWADEPRGLRDACAIAPAADVYAAFRALYDELAFLWLGVGLRPDINVNISTTEMGMAILGDSPVELVEMVAQYVRWPARAIESVRYTTRSIFLDDLMPFRWCLDWCRESMSMHHRCSWRDKLRGFVCPVDTPEVAPLRVTSRTPSRSQKGSLAMANVDHDGDQMGGIAAAKPIRVRPTAREQRRIARESWRRKRSVQDRKPRWVKRAM